MAPSRPSYVPPLIIVMALGAKSECGTIFTSVKIVALTVVAIWFDAKNVAFFPMVTVTRRSTSIFLKRRQKYKNGRFLQHSLSYPILIGFARAVECVHSSFIRRLLMGILLLRGVSFLLTLWATGGKRRLVRNPIFPCLRLFHVDNGGWRWRNVFLLWKEMLLEALWLDAFGSFLVGGSSLIGDLWFFKNWARELGDKLRSYLWAYFLGRGMVLIWEGHNVNLIRHGVDMMGAQCWFDWGWCWFDGGMVLTL